MLLSYDDILEVINNLEAPQIPDNAYTTEIWANKLGFGIKKTRRYIKKQINQGKMESMRIPIYDIAGRKNYSYVYRETE